MPDATGISHEAAAPKVGLIDRIRGKAPAPVEAPKPPAARETDARDRSEFRAAGAKEDIRAHEKKSLLSSSRQTFENVVFREYNACNTVIEANKAALNPYITKMRAGQALTPADEAGIIAAGGLTVDQLRFYVDFTTGNPKLDKPEAVLAQSAAYLQRNDRLIAAEQMAERQLGAMQRAASADVVDYEVPAEETKFAEDALIFDQEGHSATRDEALRRNRRWYQRGVFRTPGEKEGVKRADKRDKIGEQNAKKDQDIRYAGVRYLVPHGGKVDTAAGGTIQLHTGNAYEQALIGVSQISGSEEMGKYARQITDIIHARVDFYVMTGMPRSDIRAQVWEVTNIDRNTGAITYTQRGNRKADFLDVEAQHQGGANREANFAEQAKAQSEAIAKKTRTELDKAKAEKKESDRRTALIDQVNARIEELGKKSEAEQKADEAERKKLEDQKKKLDEQLAQAQKREAAGKSKKEAEDAIAKVRTERGITVDDVPATATTPAVVSEVTQYVTAREAIPTLQTDLNSLKETLVKLEKAERDYLNLAKENQRTTTTGPKNSPTTVTENDPQYMALALEYRIKAATPSANAPAETIPELEKKIAQKQADIDAEQKKMQAILKAHASLGLTEEHINNVVANRSAIQTADNDINNVNTWEAAQPATGTPPVPFKLGTPEQVQEQIAALEKQIANVGVERIQTQQAELLNTLKETIEGFEAIQQRLGQHQLGELANIPDLPHLAGYPRVYLRTLQVMFGEDVLSVAKQEDLKRYMRLLPPEKFVALAGARFPGATDMYDLAEHTEATPAELDLNMANIDADMLKAIRTDLESSARSQTLGATPVDVEIFDDIKTMKTEKPEDRTTLVAAVSPAGTLTPLYYNDAAGTHYVTDDTALNSYIAHEARDYYYYNGTQDLARRIIIDQSWDPDDPVHRQRALYLAQEIDRQRREHPAI